MQHFCLNYSTLCSQSDNGFVDLKKSDHCIYHMRLKKILQVKINDCYLKICEVL